MSFEILWLFSCCIIATSMDTLLADLVAFFGEHHDCAKDMASGFLDEQPDGSAIVWLACETCGARIVRVP